MVSYIDIHTHHHSLDPGCLAVYNVSSQFEASVSVGGYCSAGLHPWYLENAQTDIVEIEKLSGQKNVLAIGECGLDRVCKTDWELQIKMYQRQIYLANIAKKPLIIHCVRSFEDVLQTFKTHPATVPVIIHGFNKNAVIANRLLDAGFYISFGSAILQRGSNAQSVLATIDPTRFFLETDASEVSIKDIYENAARIRETSTDAIILQVAENFKKVFGI